MSKEDPAKVCFMIKYRLCLASTALFYASHIVHKFFKI